MSSIRFLLKLPLKRKLTLLLLLPCVAVLVLAGGAVSWFQSRTFRHEFSKDLNATAAMISANATAAISFNDRNSAVEILGSLSAKKYILSAVLILPDHTVFATYGNHTNDLVLQAEPQLIWQGPGALMVAPVRVEGQQVAMLNLAADYHSVHTELIKLFMSMLALVLLAAGVVAFGLSNWLQRIIADPILRLTQTAQTVATAKDYSVRAVEESGLELGVLTRSFNHMLTRIQEQDQALIQSRHRLTTLINSIDGIVCESTADTFQFTFVSEQCERMLGYSPEVWLADPGFWYKRLHPDDASRAMQTNSRLAAAGQPYSFEYRLMNAGGQAVWIRHSCSIMMEHGRPTAIRGIMLDITAQKAAASELADVNRKLIETSRQAGMAEVATGVLHNVGNVLNSVTVSASLVSQSLRQSKADNLSRAARMLRDQNGGLVEFLTSDPKGKLLPNYLCTAAEHLAAEQGQALQELTLLSENIEHIMEIVAMQQTYAKVVGAFEELNPVDLVEAALRMNALSLERHKIKVIRNFTRTLPRITVDRHKVLQILMNLIQNAQHALGGSSASEPRLELRLETNGGLVSIRVSDNGVGISPENLTRIFQHGFTTKKEGHGFGLHAGANAARELGGRLTVRSDGSGCGAEFTLELPVSPARG